jgi:hypothetical protein
VSDADTMGRTLDGRQADGKACAVCGRTRGDLRTIGRLVGPGNDVVACRDCAETL